uniref:Uncharacterized protein n=1 Tax=Lactuca sativa TaxID=4236 RepID=A0A9R1URC0_LACSA|nr:hypothetical protein LSAT_V11C800434050 [Lactuca sativa]
MGAGHARSRYLNRKEGDAEGRASDWSEVVTRRIDGAINGFNRYRKVWIDRTVRVLVSVIVLRGCEKRDHWCVVFRAFNTVGDFTQTAVLKGQS